MEGPFWIFNFFYGFGDPKGGSKSSPDAVKNCIEMVPEKMRILRVFTHNLGVLDLQKCGKNVELSSILAFFGVMVRNGSGSMKKSIFY